MTEMEPFMQNEEHKDNGWSPEDDGNDARNTESDLERGSANDVRSEVKVKSLVNAPTEIDTESSPRELVDVIQEMGFGEEWQLRTGSIPKNILIGDNKEDKDEQKTN